MNSLLKLSKTATTSSADIVKNDLEKTKLRPDNTSGKEYSPKKGHAPQATSEKDVPNDNDRPTISPTHK